VTLSAVENCKLDDQPVSQRKVVFGAVCVLIVIGAALLRVFAALNDLWLDEIWSLNLLSPLSSITQIFTQIHFDNNHYLNSIWLFMTGPHGNWPGYRIPSVIAGIGSVIMAGMIGRRQSRVNALIAMLLIGFSYMQILYSSEARGYSLAVFFSLISYFLLDRYLEQWRLRDGLLFSLSATIGFASQLVFFNFIAAAFLWTLAGLIKLRVDLQRFITTMFCCFGLPLAFFLFIYLVDLSKFLPNGVDFEQETSVNVIRGLSNALSWGIAGIAPAGSISQLPLLVIMAVVGYGSRRLWRQDPRLRSVFWLSVILLLPGLLAIIRQPNVLYARYFIVGIVFLLILASTVLTQIYERGRLGQIICGALLFAFLATNSWQVVHLLKYGHGGYSAAVSYLAEKSEGPVITVSGDHDFRIPVVLQFMARELSENRGDKFIWLKWDSWDREGPEWLLTHKENLADPAPITDSITDSFGNQYELAGVYPTAPMSGLHWYVYHNRAKMN
jgi:hypothetical protein